MSHADVEAETGISHCPACGQEMHPIDHVERLRQRIAELEQQIAEQSLRP